MKKQAMIRKSGGEHFKLSPRRFFGWCHPELDSGAINANETPLTGRNNIDRF